MSKTKFIKTQPEDALFSSLPAALYEKGSQRFQLGHDPVKKHLKGCYVLQRNQTALGRFAFYENPELEYKGQPAACFGSYECINDPSTSQELLSHAIQLAKEKDYGYLIGPMEGSTWNQYRFSDHNRHPNFFMEPYHHIYYNEQFRDVGFEAIANYFSNISRSDAYDSQALKDFEDAHFKNGCHRRHIDLQNPEMELDAIGEFCIREFSDNFLYTTIQAEEFVDKYMPLTDYFNPRLIQIIEGPGRRLEGLSFAIEDHFNDPDKTAIIKSLVRRKDSELRGLGVYLVGKTHQICHELGIREVIHALIFQDNASIRTSKMHQSEPYKSYTLYGYEL